MTGLAAPMSPALRAALEAFAAHPVVVVALDFDGTLSHLADDPSAVRPVPAARNVVDALADDDGVRLALVSGRPAGDLRALAEPPAGTALAGSHGAEVGHVTTDGDVVLAEAPLTDAERDLHGRLADELATIADGREGVWVEHKPVGVALHTRRAGPRDAAEATEAALGGPARWSGVHAIRGKDVVEISVHSATKGEAVERLRAEAGGSSAVRVPVLYAGDDVTDEKAFAVLGRDDVAIKVGTGATLAAHRVAGPEELAAALDLLVALRRALPRPG